MKITPELLTKAYTRGIQSALKGLVTDGSDLHENYTLPCYRDWETDRKSTRLNSSHSAKSRMPSSA